MHKSASDGLRMHLRTPKISKFSWGGHAPRTPYKRVGLCPFLLTKVAPVVQYAQGLLNPLGGPVIEDFFCSAQVSMNTISSQHSEFQLQKININARTQRGRSSMTLQL